MTVLADRLSRTEAARPAARNVNEPDLVAPTGIDRAWRRSLTFRIEGGAGTRRS